MALVGYDPNRKTSTQRPLRTGRATFRLLEQAITSSKARAVESQPPGRLHLVPVAGGGLTALFPVEETETILGRQKSADLRVRDGKASRQHCKIVLTGDGATLMDMGSSNGTFVNGTRVEQCKLGDGDLIRLGDTVLRVRYLALEDQGDGGAYWLATRDAGSGLHNRTYLLEALQREVARAGRHEYPLTLLMVSVDVGGVTGEAGKRLLDREMRALAADLLHEGGAGILVSRYSRTEAAALFPMLRSAEAVSLCEKVPLDRTSSSAEDTGGPLSFFTGAADFPDGADSPEQLIHHAEAALYKALTSQSGSPEIYEA